MVTSDVRNHSMQDLKLTERRRRLHDHRTADSETVSNGRRGAPATLQSLERLFPLLHDSPPGVGLLEQGLAWLVVAGANGSGDCVGMA